MTNPTSRPFPNRYMKAGLLGEKLSHSLSPAIHQKFWRMSGIAGSYELFESRRDGIEALLNRLEREGYIGINVTIPYKTEVMKHLNELSPEAEAIGSVNTVMFKGGRRLGYNTDYFGLKTLLDSSDIAIAGKSVVVLGTGGAARCALKLARDMGAQRVIAASRSPEKADVPGAVSYEVLNRLGSIDVLINTTPVGMSPHTDGCPVNESVIENCGSVVDLVYNPAETKLLSKAQTFGIKAVNGLGMLCAQAVKAQEIWNGQVYGGDIYNSVYKYMLRVVYKPNIVLIGMPGSGKTTVGRLLAERLGMEFIDTDAMVEQEHGPIPDIFNAEGEEAFRSYERKAAKKAAAAHGAVISTGGGIILDGRNIDALKETGTVVFLDRPLEALLKDTDTSGRPLLAGGKDAIAGLYRQRHGLYVKYADIITDNSSGAEVCAREIIEALEDM